MSIKTGITTLLTDARQAASTLLSGRAACLIVIMLAVIVYARTLDVPFYFDDYTYIVDNPIIHTLGGVFDREIISQAVVDNQDVKKSVLSRPLPYLTFAVNYALHRTSLGGYHAVNIAIHAINALLIYLLILLLFRRPASRQNSSPVPVEADGRGRWVAFFAATLFVVHPVMVNSVTCIFQRAVLLTTFFYLLTVISYVRWQVTGGGRLARGLWYALALLSCFAAMKCKEIAFTLPLMLVLYDGIFCAGTLRRRCLRLVPFLLLLAMIPLTLIALDSAEISGDSSQMPSTLHATSYMVKAPLAYLTTRFKTNANQTSIVSMSPLEYLLTQFRVVASYQRLLLIPVGLNFMHDFPFYRSLADPAVLLALMFHLLILSCAAYLLHAAQAASGEAVALCRCAGFGIFWFYLALAVECSIVPIDDHYHEYRIYLPACGYLLAIVALLRLALQRWKTTRMLSICGHGVLVAALIIFSLLTLMRNEQWRDPLLFWQDALAKSPKKQRIHGYIGNVYRDRGDMPRALQEYRLMLANDFRYGQEHFELGELLQENGRYRAAVEEYLIALKIRPDKTFVYGRLAEAYHLLGEERLAGEARRKATVDSDGAVW